jgi:hypothetical protein
MGGGGWVMVPVSKKQVQEHRIHKRSPTTQTGKKRRSGKRKRGYIFRVSKKRRWKKKGIVCGREKEEGGGGGRKKRKEKSKRNIHTNKKSQISVK